MRIVTLVENVSPGGAFGSAHGLSLWVETASHRILFDAGPDGALLLQNAAALGADLTAVDIAVLSHGHYDHAGGLVTFLAHNDTATLYLHREALRGHLALHADGWKTIGLDPRLMAEYGGRAVLTGDRCEIDGELLLFSDIQTKDLFSGANGSIFEEGPEGPVPDGFGHEQNLLLRSGAKTVLLAGCAHRGIVNVLRRAEDILGRAPDCVLAGFHLTNPGHGTDEPEALVRAVGAELRARRHTLFITGHCTGLGPYAILQDILGGQLEYMSVGTSFDI